MMGFSWIRKGSRLPFKTIVTGAALALWCAFAFAEGTASDQSRSQVSVQEAASGAGGAGRFTLTADHADIAEVLKALFTKIGADYAIDQDVEGPVDVRLRNETVPRILQAIEAVARPAITIRMVNGVYRVSLREPAAGSAVRLRTRFGYQPLTVVNRPVTLEVPEDHPIPLEAALERISLQTGYVIRLDRRIPRSLMFSGRILQAPLGTTLQAIADTSGLKVVAGGNEVLLVPQDRFLITLGGAAVGGYPLGTCGFCGERLLPGWRYCPHCGRPVSNPRPGLGGK
ncbi:MAG: zinc-ribbon domain-containing protein [Chthonomonadales bacterium]